MGFMKDTKLIHPTSTKIIDETKHTNSYWLSKVFKNFRKFSLNTLSPPIGYGINTKIYMSAQMINNLLRNDFVNVSSGMEQFSEWKVKLFLLRRYIINSPTPG